MPSQKLRPVQKSAPGLTANTCYNPFLVYCPELAHGTVNLTSDRAQGDDSKHDSHYNHGYILF